MLHWSECEMDKVPRNSSVFPSKRYTQSYRMVQFRSEVRTRDEDPCTQNLARKCSQHHPQQPRLGNDPMLLDGCADKRKVVVPHDGIALSPKKEQSTDTDELGRP